ncbi:MAG: LysM peptidoglycan-binding domain-containing protein [Nannocystaceae bacterium]|nr:LysM peptidoglycan-binding domain-containing protein [Nannocystaceae bacterium]
MRGLSWSAVVGCLACTPVGPPGESTPDAPFRLHRLRDGDSLSVLAEQYGVDGRAIALSNGIVDPDRVRSGRGILLPTTPSTMELPKYPPLRTGAPELTLCVTAVAPAPEPTERNDCIEAACTTLDQTTVCQSATDCTKKGKPTAHGPVPRKPANSTGRRQCECGHGRDYRSCASDVEVTRTFPCSPRSSIVRHCREDDVVRP